MDFQLLAKGIALAGCAIGAGCALIAGIGRIGGQAMDAMARQPEKMGDLRSSMIIAAALVEGVYVELSVLSLSKISSSAFTRAALRRTHRRTYR